MGLECRISFKGGELDVANADGTPSKLYAEALNFTEGDTKKALSLWRTAYTEDFVNKVGPHKDNVDLNKVLTYLDTNESLGKRLSSEERFSILSTMDKLGFSSLSEFSVLLNQIFKPNGVLALDSTKALSSGLYTVADLESLKLEDIKPVLDNLAGELLIGDILLDKNPSTKATYTNTDKKTVLGSSEKINQDDIIEELKSTVTDFSDVESIEAAVKDLPYEDFVETYKKDSTFANQLHNFLGQFSRLPILRLVGDNFTKVTSSTFSTLLNTIPAGVNVAPIKADLEILASISKEVWDNKQDLIRKIVKKIEISLATQGVDIIGMHNNVVKQELVISTIDSLVTALRNPTDSNVQVLATNLDAIKTPGTDGWVTEKQGNYIGKNINRIDTNLTAGEMFDKHNLLKVDENTFHKLQPVKVSEAYELLYQRFLDGNLSEVKTKMDAPKVQVLKDIAAYINGRDTGIDTTKQEEVSLAQVVWGHDKLDTKLNTEFLPDIKTDEHYLKTDFTLDFYKYMLEEKIKDSAVYRTVLSKISITDTDLTFDTSLKSINNIKFEQELKDYIALKKDNSIKYLIERRNTISTDEPLDKLNNPAKVKTYNRQIIKRGNLLVTEKTPEPFIKVDGKIYRQTINNETSSVFVKTSQGNPTYFTADASNYFNQEESQKALTSAIGEFGKTFRSVEEAISKARAVNGVYTNVNTESIQAKVQGIAMLESSNIEMKPTYDEAVEEPLRDIDSCN